MGKLKMGIKSLFRTGFFDIFGATIINSIVSFVYGIFIIRVLTKSDYGTFSYVQNILNFGFMFCSLGGNVGVLQFCSEATASIPKRYSYSRFAYHLGTIGSIIVFIIMMLYTRIDSSGIDNLTFYVAEFALLPFLYFIKEWITANLRWQLKNREYAIVLNVHSVLNAVLAVLGAYFWGIQGVILGIYGSYVGACFVGGIFLRNGGYSGIKKAEQLDSIQKRRFLQYSITMCIVNALISVLFTIDLFVIGNLLKDAEQIAMYKTACTIPFALNMVPNSIMTFAFPHIVSNKHDRNWMKHKIKILYLANGIINVVIGIGLLITAPVLISVLFGDSYSGILNVFRLLICSYIVSSCLRTPSANLFAILKMTRMALGISVATAIICVCCGILLVGRYGIIGAAVGSVVTFSIVGLISSSVIFYIVYIKKNYVF